MIHKVPASNLADGCTHEAPPQSTLVGAGLFLTSLVLALSACAPPAKGELLVIERLSFVPGGSHALRQVGVVARGGTPVVDGGLLVDTHEVTRGEWLDLGAPIPSSGADSIDWGAWDPGARSLPAVGMDLGEARALAELVDMRLPTVAEWLWCAIGPRGQPHPYGLKGMASAVNTLEVGLGRVVPVGTFASGRTPGSLLADLEGNVWEWCQDGPPEGIGLIGGGEFQVGCAMGGSFLETAQNLHGEGGILARGLDPRHRAIDLGMRRVCDAGPWLLRHAHEFSHPEDQSRIEGVGRRWGRPALEMLRSLEAQGMKSSGSNKGLTWLRMGAER